MRVYISGQITGLDPQVSQSYFQLIEDQLTKNGHIAVNPWKVLPYDPKHKYEDYMAEDVRVLLTCDAIIMLENWRNSKGAKMEHAIAEIQGMKMCYCQNHDLI